jgi:predicted nucleotidyltransferase component of viral defense system
LANQARAKQRPFQELLQYYAMERFLYRLSRSRHADEFVLKGALLMTAWQAPLARSTMDIDLLGRTSNELDHIRTVFAGLCDIESEPDGVFFDSKSVKVARVKEDADYEGTRIRFHATLARARIPMQIDIGFGDVVVPGIVNVQYPTLLEFPAPVLRAYPKETVIAEKLEALTILAALNSRMKDFYDLWALSRLDAFEGSVLLKAIQATFARRETAIEARPFGLEQEFANDRGRSMQWTAFLRRSRIASAPESLAETVHAIREFAHPVLSAAASGRPLDQNWRAGGPWSF